MSPINALAMAIFDFIATIFSIVAVCVFCALGVLYIICAPLVVLFFLITAIMGVVEVSKGQFPGSWIMATWEPRATVGMKAIRSAHRRSYRHGG